MGELENLIQQISDKHLCEELLHETRKLKSQKQFGLVFEGHFSETMLIPSFLIKGGHFDQRRFIFSMPP
jgi:hypothetical protein